MFFFKPSPIFLYYQLSVVNELRPERTYANAYAFAGIRTYLHYQWRTTQPVAHIKAKFERLRVGAQAEIFRVH